MISRGYDGDWRTPTNTPRTAPVVKSGSSLFSSLKLIKDQPLALLNQNIIDQLRRTQVPVDDKDAIDVFKSSNPGTVGEYVYRCQLGQGECEDTLLVLNIVNGKYEFQPIHMGGSSAIIYLTRDMPNFKLRLTEAERQALINMDISYVTIQYIDTVVQDKTALRLIPGKQQDTSSWTGLSIAIIVILVVILIVVIIGLVLYFKYPRMGQVNSGYIDTNVST